jgi:predicted TIM-barrel fold metal-dependent hydrolase
MTSTEMMNADSQVGTTPVTHEVIDADSHLTEPPELWLDRMPRNLRDHAPRVLVDPETGIERWRIGDTWCAGVGTQSQSGWRELPPSFPPTWSDIEPACYDLSQRLVWMDEHGVHAQVLYPNVVTFEAYAIMALKSRDAQLAIFRAYNDYVYEVSRVAPDRFVPIATVPFWDVSATVDEMTRCAEMGFTGMVWAATMVRHGLPPIGDHHWDPVYERAQALGMSINFHVGVGSTAEDIASFRELRDGKFDYGYWAGNSTLAFLANSSTMTTLITSGVCHRFPDLKFVSVESGFGFVPYLLEALDWQWHNIGAPKHHPGWLLPSEYFRRQILCTFWFEHDVLGLLPDFQDNVMFETDFPHSTSLAPGGASLAPSPREVIAADAELVSADVLEKVLSTNARRLYRLG